MMSDACETEMKEYEEIMNMELWNSGLDKHINLILLICFRRKSDTRSLRFTNNVKGDV